MSLWPDSNRATVVLSFDLDAESLWIARDPKNLERPMTLSQGEYGPRDDVPRILKLLRKYGLKATFFVTGWVLERYPETVREILAGGHEMGHHGYHHEWPDTLTLDEEREILEKGISLIRDMDPEGPFGYRSPAWEFGPHTLDLLINHGFLYSSNMMNGDLPYRHRRDGGETGIIEIPVSWMLDGAPYFLYSPRLVGRTITDPSHVYSIWEQEYSAFYRGGALLRVDNAPTDNRRPSRIVMLERLIRRMKGDPGVWFATARDVAEYWLSRPHDAAKLSPS